MIYKNITFKADPFSYDLEFDDRITLVGGDSGTGKTVLWYKDCCVSEHPDNLRCGKPDVEDGNEKMRMLIQSEEVHKIISTIIGYKKEGDKLEFHTL